jgi:hypothetical protein
MREDATGARDRERAERVPRGGEGGRRTTGREDARTLLVSEGRAGRGKFERDDLDEVARARASAFGRAKKG